MKRETYNFLSHNWEKHVKRCAQENVDTTSVICEEIEKWCLENNTYIAVTSMSTGKSAYESRNFTQFSGFESSPDLSQNMYNFIKRINSHDFPCFNIGFELLNSLVVESLVNGLDYEINHYNCGLNYTHDTKGKIKLFYDFVYSCKVKDAGPEYVIMNFSDITEYFEGEYFWVKIEVKNENGLLEIRTYRNDNKEYSDDDFFQLHEKAALKLLVQGKSMSEIAQNIGKSEGELNNELTITAQSIGMKNLDSLVKMCSKYDFFNLEAF